MKRTIVQPQAEREAADWYEEQREGLGVEFLLEVDAAIERAGESPEPYVPVYKQIRRVLLRRFPYAAYFLDEPNAVQVIAILHQRRPPAGRDVGQTNE